MVAETTATPRHRNNDNLASNFERSPSGTDAPLAISSMRHQIDMNFLTLATSNDHEEIECHGKDGHHWHGWGLTRTTSIVSIFNIIQPYNSAQLSALH